MSKLYAHRDTEELGIDEHYYKHVEAMTSEGLHSKAAIAAELAFRDARIVELEEALRVSDYKAFSRDQEDMHRSPNEADYEPHPLLSKDRSRLLAEAARVDGDYL